MHKSGFDGSNQLLRNSRRGAFRTLTDSEKEIAGRLWAVPTDRAQFLSSASSNKDWFDAFQEELLKLLQQDEDAIADIAFWEKEL